MGKDFYENIPEAREVFDRAGEVLGWDAREICFGKETGKINLTEYTQPAILVSSVAAWETLKAAVKAAGIEMTPACMAGHSLGEYTAWIAAGGIDYPEALSIVQMRGRLMQQAVPEGEGLMAAILGLEKEKVVEVCKEASLLGIVSPANYNGPSQVVIAGVRPAVEKAGELAKMRGAKRVIPLQVSVPSHCTLMEPAAEKMRELFGGTAFRPLKTPVITNVDARPVRSAEGIRDALSRQLTHPVRWDESVAEMISSGCELFVEVGPGKVLSGLVKRISETLSRPVRTVRVEDRSSLEETLSVLKASRGGF
jgi:[acyl-carrier-protein] S-malonyltransferase